MAEEFLHRTDVVAGFEEMRGKGVAKGVRSDVFVDPSQASSFGNGFLQSAGMDMMATHFTTFWVLIATAGWKQKLPH